MRRLLAATLLTTAGWAFAEPSAVEQPLAVRDTSPLALLYGLPRMHGGTVAGRGGELNFGVDHASSFTGNVAGDDLVFFDGETSVFALRYRHAMGPAWEWGVEVPYVQHDGGFLDAFIDDFHEAFGFTDGGRESAPRDRLDYLVRIDGIDYADVDSSTGGIGDLRGFLGRRLFDDSARSAALRLQIKAPTGKASKLTGSGAWDTTAWVEMTERALLQRIGMTVTLGAGAAFLGDGDIAPDDQESVVGIGHLGLQWPVWGGRLTFKGQLDAHTAPLDRALPQTDHVIQGTLGGHLRVGQRYWLDFALIEDLKTKSSPDAVFQLAIGGRF